MQFNAIDKSNSIIADIDFLLFGNSAIFNTDYSLIDRTRNVNISLDEVVADLHKADPNYKWDDTSNTDFPFATLALTAGQDHYTLLDSAIVIHRVRIKDRNGVLQTLTSRVRSELTDSELRATGTPTEYYKIGQAVFPVPIPDYSASAGVALEFQRGANHFSTSDISDVPGFNPQFHQYLSVSAALRYAIANGMTKKIKELRAEKASIKEAILIHYERRSPDDRTRIRLKRSVKGYGL